MRIGARKFSLGSSVEFVDATGRFDLLGLRDCYVYGWARALGGRVAGIWATTGHSFFLERSDAEPFALSSTQWTGEASVQRFGEGLALRSDGLRLAMITDSLGRQPALRVFTRTEPRGAFNPTASTVLLVPSEMVVYRLAWSPDGQSLAVSRKVSGRGEVALLPYSDNAMLDWSTAVAIRGFRTPGGIAWSDDGLTLYVIDRSGDPMFPNDEIQMLTRTSLSAPLQLSTTISAPVGQRLGGPIAISADGRILALGGGEGVFVYERSATVCLSVKKFVQSTLPLQLLHHGL